MAKKVRVNAKYIYNPCIWDSKIQPPVGAVQGDLNTGDEVRVVNLPGCPKANTMGQCYIATPDKSQKFLGMVHTSSLETPAEYAAFLAEKAIEAQRKADIEAEATAGLVV